MKTFRKKTAVVEAVQFETNNDVDNQNMNDIVAWINQGKSIGAPSYAWHNGTNIFLQASTGASSASVGDWIIKGADGEFSACGSEIFGNAYEEVVQ